jgi:hypothetical protein
VAFIISEVNLFRLRSRKEEDVFSSFGRGFANAAGVPTDSVAVIGMEVNGDEVKFVGRRLEDVHLLVSYRTAEVFSTGEMSVFFGAGLRIYSSCALYGFG